jgi:3-dehydroquinate synthase
MIKHGLIYDSKHFDEVISNFNDLTSLISDSVSIKQAVVAQDPTEKGLRKILNFGHTLGHAIESFYLETPASLLHGEAIAVGMILEAYLSHRELGLSNNELVAITNPIKSFYDLPIIDPADYQDIIELTKQDKKNEHGSVRFVGLKQIGKAVYDVPLEAEGILEAFSYYKGIIL